MILPWLIAIPIAAGLLAMLLSRWSATWPRWISLAALGIELALVLDIWARHLGRIEPSRQGPWLMEFHQEWIPQFGISFLLALDGLSLLLIALTAFVGIAAVIASWTEIRERVGFFHFSLMSVLAGMVGVFLALDLFLFYFLWEVMLVPAYLLFLWGYERRFQAGVKFFLFTQLSGLLMLVAILGLVFVHRQSTGSLTFSYLDLLGTPIGGAAAIWLMLGFFVAFAVKLPVVPFHTWLPDAYAESPTAATVVLAALMAKTGGYGMVRFVVPLFPHAAISFAPVAMALGVAGILYGAFVAFAQTDLKRLVAYSSVSGMGFVVLGVFAWNDLALEGAVVQMLAHGVTTGALFILVGALQERTHTRDMGRMGGLWSTAPRLAGVTLLFALATMGLPGLGNFVGELLVLVGAFQVSAWMAALAALGIILSAVYALWMIQRTFHGPNEEGWRLPDLSRREATTVAAMVVAILWLGLFPQPVLDTARQALGGLQQQVATELAAWPPDEGGGGR